MKHLRTDAEAFLHFLIDPGIAVLWIPAIGCPMEAEVGADLVGSSGDQMNLQKVYPFPDTSGLYAVRIGRLPGVSSFRIDT